VPALKIPFAKVVCDGRELEYIREVLASGWLTTAGQCRAFEEEFGRAVGALHSLAVNSCTSALHLALEAAGVKAGDEVIVPALTFTSTAEVVRYLGADPVIADVDSETGLLKPETVRDLARARPRVRAVIPVHYGGQSVRLLPDETGPGLLDVAREEGLKIIEDAAHAFPSRYRAGGPMVGSLAETICCFSFYANKPITSAAGGLLATGSEEAARRARIMRMHGIDREVWDRSTSTTTPSWQYDVVAPGYKCNLSDVLAAIGRAQLERAEEFRRERERCARRYLAGLGTLKNLALPRLRGGLTLADHSWHLFPVVLEPGGPDRDRLIEDLSARGIGLSVHYRPLYRMKYYAERYRLAPSDFPGTEKIWAGTFSLPIYPSLSDGEIDYICAALGELAG
jgi:dTDP-4-amino-4,6-dideoxygalactose transaminase